MVWGLHSLLAVSVTLWSLSQHCRALDHSVLPRNLKRDGRNKTPGHTQPMKCETTNLQTDSSPYHVLPLEPGENAAMFFASDGSSSLRCTSQRPADVLFVAHFDSFDTSFRDLLDMYTVFPGSKCYLTKYKPSGTLGATEHEITPLAFGCHILCRPLGLSVPPGELILPFESGREMAGTPIVFINNGNGILGTMSSIIYIADARDTPSSGTSEAFSRCRPSRSWDILFRLCEPSRSTAFRFRRSLSDHPHMQRSRNSTPMVSSLADTVAIAVCVSLGATGFVAMAIFIIIKYRRRQKILVAQDTLPRPFEITVPVAATAGTSTTTNDLTLIPLLDVSPQRVCSQNGRRSEDKAQREETLTLTRVKLQRSDSMPIPTRTTLSQSQPGPSRETPHSSDTSLLPNRAGPSSYRPLPRSCTHPHTPTPPDPPSQSSSHVNHGHSPSSLPTAIQSPQQQPSTRINRAISFQERRSAKRAVWPSHSASELYRASSAASRYHVPENGSHVSSGWTGHAHRSRGDDFHVDTFARATNHLRQWGSASPVVHVHHVGSEDSEDGGGGAIIIQHQDAGVMQELPPPYHKLVRSEVEV